MSFDTWAIIGVILTVTGIQLKYYDMGFKSINQRIDDFKAEVKDFKTEVRREFDDLKKPLIKQG